MSTTIGSLAVDVTLELSRMDAQFRELQTKTSKNMAQLKRQFRDMSNDANRSVGGIGRGRGGRGGGGFGGALAGEFLKRGVGRMTGLGEGLSGKLLSEGASVLRGGAGFAGAAGMALAPVAALKGLHVVGEIAKQSGRMDDAALAAGRLGESIGGLVPSFKDVSDSAKGLAVSLVGNLASVGEWIGAGFDRSQVDAFNESARGAKEAEARLADFKKRNDPEKLAQVRERIAEFRRDQEFAGAGEKGQMQMLAAEIQAMQAKEAQLRAAKEILQADTLRLEILKKSADLEERRKAYVEKREANEAEIVRLREKVNAEVRANEEEARREKERMDAMRDNDKKRDALRDQIGEAQSRVGQFRNPFEIGRNMIGATSLGGANGNAQAALAMMRAGAHVQSENDRLAQKQVDLLREMLGALDAMAAELRRRG